MKLYTALLAILPLVSAQICDEGSKLVCYGKPSGESQNINLDDLEYAAWEFRRLSEDGPAFWTMPANITKRGCDEWMMFEIGTVLALAKHTNNRITSSVSFDDIADTIDGGPEATPEQREKAIMGCGGNGGQLLVQVKPDNPAYQTEKYKATGGTPKDILIKIVRAPGSL